MTISSFALSFVVDPISFIYVAVGMHKFPLTIGFVVAPFAFIAGAIRPQLCSVTITHPVEPLASVYSAIFQSKWSLSDASILISLLAFPVITICTLDSPYYLLLLLVTTCFQSLLRSFLTAILKFKVIVSDLKILLVEAILDLALVVISLAIAVARAVTHYFS